MKQHQEKQYQRRQYQKKQGKRNGNGRGWKEYVSKENQTQVCGLKGSVTIEMAYILPIILLLFLLVVYTVFYYHDKNILIGAAAETAVTGAQAARQKGRQEPDMQNFYRERVGNKLILLRLTEVNVSKSKKQVEVTVSAGKGRMSVSVVQRAGIPGPEDKIRKKRQLESLAQERSRE